MEYYIEKDGYCRNSVRHKVAGTGNFWVNAINFRVITVRVGPRAIRFYLRLYLFHIQPVITFVRDCIVIFILIFL